jgi:DNA-binding MarR family transcriptional regulator
VPETKLRSYLAYLLSEAQHTVNRGLADALAAQGMSVERWRILRALDDGHGHSMSDLAEAVLMPHPTLTKAIDRLIDDALVYRRQDEADRRRVAVFLADRGRRAIVAADRLAEEHHRAIEASFGQQRTERLMAELSRLVESLR